MVDGLRIDTRLGTLEPVAAAAPKHAQTLAAMCAAVARMYPGATGVASARRPAVTALLAAAHQERQPALTLA